MGITKIGRYEIIEELGQGAMGIVYKGRDTAINRIVAIKTAKFPKDVTETEKKNLIQRSYQEARIAGQLSHPNITTIYDVGEHEEMQYTVMEYVDGKELPKIMLEKKAPSFKQKINIIILIGRALHYAHQKGIIHRDIKPANIMVVDDLQIKIMDFGIAKLAASKDSLFKTQPGLILGTPAYMSPEQLSGEDLNRQTDIFSLGVLSYELLTDKKPFQAENLTALIKNIAFENPKPASQFNSQIPREIDKILLKSLEKKREHRYQTASEFADDLELFLNQEEVVKTQTAPGSEGYNKKNLIQSLKNNYTFFSDFTDSELHDIFKISSKKIYRKGSVVFKENTIGNQMFIIISGEILITKHFKKGEETILNTLKVGDSFGEMSIMDCSPRYASAIAKSDSLLIAISEVILRNSEPKLCIKLYKNLSSILSEKLKKSDATINELRTIMKNKS